MTYDAYDTSVQDGQAVELYEFIMGAETWRYTNQAWDYSYGGHTWASVPGLGRTEIALTTELASDGITVTFPRDDEFAQQFRSGLTEQACSLTLYRGHADDPDQDFIAAWKGRVAGASQDGPEIKLACESVNTSARRQGLRARCQKPCRHALYRGGCGLNAADFAEASVAVSLVGDVLTVDTARADGWFTGGYVEAPDGSMRYVMAHTGQALTLSRPHPVLAADIADSGWGMNWGNDWGGIPLILYPGCDHTLQTCHEKFSNHLNNGGWAWFTTKNPFGGSSIV